jgi:hypothetical protein
LTEVAPRLALTSEIVVEAYSFTVPATLEHNLTTLPEEIFEKSKLPVKGLALIDTAFVASAVLV